MMKKFKQFNLIEPRTISLSKFFSKMGEFNACKPALLLPAFSGSVRMGRATVNYQQLVNYAQSNGIGSMNFYSSMSQAFMASCEAYAPIDFAIEKAKSAFGEFFSGSASLAKDGALLAKEGAILAGHAASRAASAFSHAIKTNIGAATLKIAIIGIVAASTIYFQPQKTALLPISPPVKIEIISPAKTAVPASVHGAPAKIAIPAPSHAAGTFADAFSHQKSVSIPLSHGAMEMARLFGQGSNFKHARTPNINFEKYAPFVMQAERVLSEKPMHWRASYFIRSEKGWKTMIERLQGLAPLSAQFSKKRGIDPLLALAVAFTETNGRASASQEGNCLGICQNSRRIAIEAQMDLGFTRDDAKQKIAKVGFHDDAVSMNGGTYELSRQLSTFKNSDLALIAYNGGGGMPRRVRDSGSLPMVFRSYLEKVYSFMQLFGDMGVKDALSGEILPTVPYSPSGMISENLRQLKEKFDFKAYAVQKIGKKGYFASRLPINKN